MRSGAIDRAYDEHDGRDRRDQSRRSAPLWLIPRLLNGPAHSMMESLRAERLRRSARRLSPPANRVAVRSQGYLHRTLVTL